MTTGARCGGLLLASGLLLVAAAACSSEDLVFQSTPQPVDPRIITVTMDRCECDNCRLSLANPETGEIFYNGFSPPIGVEIEASNCHEGEMIRVTLECGLCNTGAACTAEATVTAIGVDMAGTTVRNTLIDTPATCTTLNLLGDSCAYQDIQTIDSSWDIINCFTSLP